MKDRNAVKCSLRRNLNLFILIAASQLVRGQTVPSSVLPAFSSTRGRNLAINQPLRRSSIFPFRQYGEERWNALSAAVDDESQAISGTSEQPTSRPPTSTSRSSRERGIYARPSAAIERGSGFFIPGLEGSRIRFLFGITVLMADVANRFLVDSSRSGDTGQLVADSLALFYGAFLLLQASIETGAEKGLARGLSSASLPSDQNAVSGGMNQEERDLRGQMPETSNTFSSAPFGKELDPDLLRRISRAIITFTPATCVQLVEKDFGILYSLGIGKDDVPNTDKGELTRSIEFSLDAVAGSRGGRVAVPSDHPASKLVPETARRCILIQRIDIDKGQGCMLIGSDKLLPSFTKNDLKWIGRLAEYVKTTK